MMNNAAQSQARVRIDSLLDANSFVEIGAAVTARSTDFILSDNKAPSDGVITGYGLISGRPVYIYSQDVSVLRGTLGEMHAGKIVRLYDLAIKTGDPVIALLDCAGMRLEEGLDGLQAFGEVLRAQTEASGVIPQIAAVFGTCGGSMAMVPALSDFVFIEEQRGSLFLQAPDTIRSGGKQAGDTSSAGYRYSIGDADAVGTEEEIFSRIRSLFAFLPSNLEDTMTPGEPDTDLNELQEDLQAWSADPMQILLRISDRGDVFEACSGWASDMVTVFVRLGGMTAGVVANRSFRYGKAGEPEEEFEPVITPAGARKAARFVSFCDAFSIPVITFANARGMDRSMESERTLTREAAHLAGVLASASTPRIAVLTETVYGTPYLLLGSRSLGADLVYAWKDAEIGMMDAQSAAKILADSADKTVVAETAGRYADLQNSAASASARGYVDTVIEPAETRKYLIGALDMLFTKRDERPRRKHDTI